MTEQNLFYLTLVWLLVVFFIATFGRVKKDMPSVNLPLLYVFTLTINHWLGAFIHTLPYYTTDAYEVVYSGFVQAVIGIVSFGVGGFFLAPALMHIFKIFQPKDRAFIPHPRLAETYLTTGIVFAIVLAPVLLRVPSIRTLAYSGWSLSIIGICLSCWQSWQKKKDWRLVLWIGVACVFPFVSVVFQGFLGFGTMALLVVLFFIASFYRPRIRLVIGGLFFFYIGLSVFVTYMRDRADIREVVWYESADVSTRVDTLSNTMGDFEWFSLSDYEHLRRINLRMNQNYLVGRAIEFIDSGKGFAHGSTFLEAAIGIIPRLLWPDKPVTAGSGDIVSDYTGIYFAEGTSVGVGQVMEFYINFGTAGVIVGFLLLGLIIRLFDVSAGHALIRGDYQRFIFWFLPGLGLLQAAGSMVEVVQSVTSAFIFCFIINNYVLKHFTGKRFSLKALLKLLRER